MKQNAFRLNLECIIEYSAISFSMRLGYNFGYIGIFLRNNVNGYSLDSAEGEY